MTLQLKGQLKALKGLKAFKTEGSGNSFVMLDVRQCSATDLNKQHWHKWAKPLCKEFLTDGLVVLKTDSPIDRALFFNSDTTSAGMCGNAARVLGTYLLGESSAKTVEFVLGDFVVKARGIGSMVEVRMPVWECEKTWHSSHGQELYLGGKGAQHVLVAKANPWQALKQEALKLSTPPGSTKKVNVTFFKKVSPQECEAMTFERGVGFTKACGTGAVAVASLLRQKDLAESVCHVKMPGGVLRVRFDADHDPWLSGEVMIEDIGLAL